MRTSNKKIPSPKLTPEAAVCVSRRFRASAERVFNAWLDPQLAGQWLFATAARPISHVVLNARVGGTFRFVDRRDGEVVRHTGKYLEILAPRRLAFSLSLAKHPQSVTRVTVEMTPSKGGCELTLRHDGVPASERAEVERRWTGILYGLGVTLG